MLMIFRRILQIVSPKRLIRRFGTDPAIAVIERLGFVHRSRWYVNGPVKRLIIQDLAIDKRKRLGYANTIFNTRSGSITIGRNVIFGHDVMILTGRHRFDYTSPLQFKEHIDDGFNIIIEDGVWITSGSILTGGIKVGTGSVILPGSVVTKDIPPFVIVGGVPAQVVKPIF